MICAFASFEDRWGVATLTLFARCACARHSFRQAHPEEATGLKEVLAELLLASGHREAALALNVELGKPGVLDLLADSREQLAGVRDKIAQLAALDHDGVVPLLVEERMAVPPESVVLQLRAAVRRPSDRPAPRAEQRTLPLSLGSLSGATLD